MFIFELEINKTMKDFSLFLLKNSLGAKMRKGFKNLCNSDNSTSTLDQQKGDRGSSSSSCTMVARPLVNSPLRESHTTLEEMILKLEMEEKMASRSPVDDQYCFRGVQHRMSCVNSSDILRSARNALNQYPRFSLDGKDSMYRCSFTNLGPLSKPGPRLPGVIAGESVIWCNPGVVAKLMGLDAMPIPLKTCTSSGNRRERLSAIIKRQNLKRISADHQRCSRQHELESRRFMAADNNNFCGFGTRTKTGVIAAAGSCSKTAGYCVMNPVAVELPNGEVGNWPIRRFL